MSVCICTFYELFCSVWLLSMYLLSCIHCVCVFVVSLLQKLFVGAKILQRANVYLAR